MDEIESLLLRDFVEINVLHDLLAYGRVAIAPSEFERRSVGSSFSKVEKSRENFKQDFLFPFKRDALSINCFMRSQSQFGSKLSVKPLVFVGYVISKGFRVHPKFLISFDRVVSKIHEETQGLNQKEPAKDQQERRVLVLRTPQRKDDLTQHLIDLIKSNPHSPPAVLWQMFKEMALNSELPIFSGLLEQDKILFHDFAMLAPLSKRAFIDRVKRLTGEKGGR